MDIPALSMAMSQSRLMNEVNVAVLSQSLDMYQTAGDMITKQMMEASVNPELGGNIDISV